LRPDRSLVPIDYDPAKVQSYPGPGFAAYVVSSDTCLKNGVELVGRNPSAVIGDRKLPGTLDSIRGHVHADQRINPPVLARVLEQVPEQEPEQHLIGDDVGQRITGDCGGLSELVNLSQASVRLVKRVLRGDTLPRRGFALAEPGSNQQAICPAQHP